MENWNAKVKCINVLCHLDSRGFERDKVYEVKNGRLIFPNGEKSQRIYNSADELNGSFYAVFTEVSE